MFRLHADSSRLVLVAVAVGILLLAGCVVTPEPIPLFDGYPVGIKDSGPQSKPETGPTMDALSADFGVIPPQPDGWAIDAPGMADGLHLMDSQPDLVDDGAPADGPLGEGGPGEGGPGEGGPSFDASSPTPDGPTDDTVARE